MTSIIEKIIENISPLLLKSYLVLLTCMITFHITMFYSPSDSNEILLNIKDYIFPNETIFLIVQKYLTYLYITFLTLKSLLRFILYAFEDKNENAIRQYIREINSVSSLIILAIYFLAIINNYTLENFYIILARFFSINFAIVFSFYLAREIKYFEWHSEFKKSVLKTLAALVFIFLSYEYVIRNIHTIYQL